MLLQQEHALRLVNDALIVCLLFEEQEAPFWLLFRIPG